MSDSMVETWRKIILGAEKSWVVFKNGTCVILMEPADDLEVQAIEIIKEWGPVHAGSPAGDFNVIKLSNHPGWVVGGHHPDILNYVGEDEYPEGASDVAVGVAGRTMRNADGENPEVIHVEDRRPKRPC